MTDISKESVERLARDCDQAQRDHDQETYDAHLHHDCAKTLRAVSAEVERLTAALDTALKGEQESEANLAHALHQLATARDNALEEVAIKVEKTAYFTNEEIETMSEMRRGQERATIGADRAVHRTAASIRAMKGKRNA